MRLICVSGIKGSGKTTLIKAMIRRAATIGMSSAAIVNESGRETYDEVFVEDSFANPPAQDPTTSDPALVPNPEPLTDALARFDAVSRNPDYRVISRLSSFKITHERLATFTDLLGQSPENAPVEGPLLELVPTPEPVDD